MSAFGARRRQHVEGEPSVAPAPAPTRIVRSPSRQTFGRLASATPPTTSRPPTSRQRVHALAQRQRAHRDRHDRDAVGTPPPATGRVRAGRPSRARSPPACRRARGYSTREQVSATHPDQPVHRSRRRERQQGDGADQRRGGRDRDRVVAAEQRLREHVVRGERRRRDEREERPLELEPRRCGRAGRMTTTTPANAGEARGPTAREPLEAEGERHRERHRGRPGDNHTRRPRRRRALARVQGQMVEGDDEEPRGDHPQRVPACQPRQASARTRAMAKPGAATR